MSASMSNRMIKDQGLSSSLRIEEETMLVQKQGIVTIAAATSLRRTISADMSSKTWLSQNGVSFSPMKEIANASSDEEGEDDYEEMEEVEAERERFQIWSSIQQNKEQLEKPAAQLDTWSSILLEKANEEDSLKSLPPYIHPLVKRSKSSLSEKSLEICTESLGSETGSDGFSSYPSSETGDDADAAEEENKEQQQQPEKKECFEVPKYNYAATSKKCSSRSFPPPLPSIHMRSHRDRGRLFLEAVSVPPQNNFFAERHDGRLVLTFAEEESNEDGVEVDEQEEKNHMEELEEEFVGFENDDDDDDEKELVEDETGEVVVGEIKQAPTQRLALMMNKTFGLVNNNPNWSEKFNKMAYFEGVNVVAQSLPPRPRVSRLIPSAPAVASVARVAGATFNADEYFWRTNPTEEKAASVPNPLNNSSTLKNSISSKVIVSGDFKQTLNERQRLVVLRGKNGDYLVHNLKSCKDSRRSLLFWEPYCIAT